MALKPGHHSCLYSAQRHKILDVVSTVATSGVRASSLLPLMPALRRRRPAAVHVILVSMVMVPAPLAPLGPLGVQPEVPRFTPN